MFLHQSVPWPSVDICKISAVQIMISLQVSPVSLHELLLDFKIKRQMFTVFSGRERSRSLYVVVNPSVCRLSVTFVRATQPVEIFGNVSTLVSTLAIR